MLSPDHPRQTDLPGGWPILILTLDSDTARRQPLLDNLGRLGLPCGLFPALDGRHGLPPEAEARFDRARALQRIGRTIGDAEIACTLSHNAIYHHIVTAGLPGAIVLEDDALIGPDFAAYLRAGGHLQAGFQLFTHAHTRVFAHGARQMPCGISGYRVATSPVMAAAYALSRDSARALIAKSEPLHGLADWPCDIFALGALALQPQLASHPTIGRAPSHLACERKPEGMTDGTRRKLKRARRVRFLNLAYWHYWLRKRFSTPLNDPDYARRVPIPRELTDT